MTNHIVEYDIVEYKRLENLSRGQASPCVTVFHNEYVFQTTNRHYGSIKDSNR